MGSVSFESKTPNMIKILVLSVLLAIVAAEDCKGKCRYWWNGCRDGEKETDALCSVDWRICCEKDDGTDNGGTDNGGTDNGDTDNGGTDNSGSGTSDGSCGVVKHSRDGWRIVGGFEAKKGQFPWQVQVQNGGSHWCGGALIDEEWVVSAAHCFYQMGNNFKFVVGQHNIAQKENSEQVFKAAKIINHPQYDDYNIKHDVTLIKLNGKVKLNDYATKVCLPKKGESFTSLSCTVSGWGPLREGGNGPDKLNAVNVPIMTLDACRQQYGKSSIFGTNVCAGYSSGGKDACQGDSGGPLACKKNNEAWKLTGVVSWGEGCARKGKAGVYTDVASYIDWINKTMGK